MKIAGVRAGKVQRHAASTARTCGRSSTSRSPRRASTTSARTCSCETRPQSLIGEYFIDCRPGTDPERLQEGGTIPVEQTETTVPLDLINNIMRRPYRERFSILLSELGAGLAARGPDLNETIRRAVPALRQVDRLLAILAEQRVTIRNLYDDAEEVMAEVAAKRERGRPVRRRGARHRARRRRRGGRASSASGRRSRPSCASCARRSRQLELTADEQIPALRNLRTAAPLPARALRDARAVRRGVAARRSARSPTPRSRAAGPSTRHARRSPSCASGVDDLPEAANNLAITLEHIDDPTNAVEKDARAGRGPDSGYTGLESLIRYFFRQSQAINLFDASSYILKASVFLDRPCANYADAKLVKDGTAPERCRAWLGPNQPGVTSADPTATGGGDARARRATATRRARRQAGASGGDRDGDGKRDGPGRAARATDGDGNGAAGLDRRPRPRRRCSTTSLPEGVPEVPKVPETPEVPDVRDERHPAARPRTSSTSWWAR